MKRLVAIVSASVLALVLAGCASGASSSASSESMSASDVSESASDVSESASSASSEAEPALEWTEAKTAEEAAKAAGVKEFIVPEAGAKISLGELGEWTYYYTEDMVEADGGAAAAEIVIRKGLGNGDNTQGSGSMTGYGRDFSEATYAHEWSIDMDGTDVRCYGNEKGTVSKAIWADGKYSYSILVLGQGDNWQDFGVPEDDIAVLVKGTKKAEVKEEEKSEESKQAEEPNNEEESNGQPKPEGDPGLDFNQLVWDNGLGQYEYTGDVFQAQDGAWYWPVFSRGADGKLYAHYFDVNGNYCWSDEEALDDGSQNQAQNQGDKDGVANMSEGDIENLVWQNGLGEFVSAEFQPTDGDTVDAWRVIVHNTEGEEVVVFFNDEDGGYTIY